MSTYTYTPNLYQFPSLLKALAQTSGPSPSLDLRFALDKSLTAYRGPTPSFSRASTGSYFDASGVLRYANVNILTYSEDFSDGSWTKANSVSITANDIVAPNGTLTADRMTAASNISSVYKSMTVISGQTYSFSVFAKAGNFSKIVMEHRQSGINPDAVFDLSNGTLVSGTGVITSVGNGWYRCSISEATVDTSDLFIIGFESTATNGSYVYLWGAQLEASSTVGTYCPTTSAANSAPRFNHTYNGTSWVSRGLLVEEQRTNLFLYSNDFSNAAWNKNFCSITSSATTGPDGTTSASALVEDSTTNYHDLYQRPSGGTTAGVTYTFSAFIKAAGRTTVGFYFYDGGDKYTNFNLSTETVGTNTAGNTATITNVGNGWYRCSITRTIGTSSVNGGGYISSGGYASLAGLNATGYYIYGAQIEVGAFPTSYIPTTSASVTRSADVCQITGTDFSGFWNQPEGTFACELDVIGFDSGKHNYFGVASTGSISQYAFVGRYSANPTKDINFQLYNGAAYCDINSGSGTTSPTKVAFGMKVNDCAASVNGGAIVSDSTVTMTTALTQLEIGNFLGANYLNGHISRLRYYNKRLPNATLQQLSDPDPTLNLQFALNKTLTPVAGPAPSFSRASTGSYFDSTGTLKYANVNLLTYSEQFENSAWTKYESTIGQTLYSSPNGSLSARRIIETSNNDLHATWRQIVTTVSGTFTDTIYMKAGERQYGYLQIANSANDRYTVLVDLVNGLVVTTNTSGTIANQSNSIESVGNGWYRIRVTASFPNGGTYVQLIAGPSNSSTPTFIYGCPSYAGDTSKGIYIFGAQLENGSSPSQYAKTEASTTAGPRFDHVYSGGQWVSRGLLLEEQRTNLAQYSEDLTNAFWPLSGCTISANSGVAPDGNSNADKIIENIGTVNAGPYTNGISMTSGTTYTASAFVKANGRSILILYFQSVTHPTPGRIAWFNLANGATQVQSGVTATITNVGNGWYRITTTATANATNAASGFGILTVDAMGSIAGYTGDGVSGFFAWGLSCEAGSFATSYIPSLSNSSTTRSADVCQITGTSFNWMWNQGEGSFVVNYDCPAVGTLTQYQANSAGSTNIHTAVSVGTTQYFQVYLPPEQALINAGSITANIPQGLSSAYKLNDFAASLNGASVVVDTSGSLPTPTKLIIGSDGSGYNNGHISKLIYYPARLTNTKLQQLST